MLQCYYLLPRKDAGGIGPVTQQCLVARGEVGLDEEEGEREEGGGEERKERKEKGEKPADLADELLGGELADHLLVLRQVLQQPLETKR
jgi:hypothetical protein